MSRCFPYPPPGYALSSDRKDALIESIKLQKQKVQAEEQMKKEKRRDKKEKKKDKKEKKDKKDRKDKRSQKKDNSDIVHSHFGENIWTAKADFSHNGSKIEPEQLERSSLTEEHAKPVCLRGPSSSSDSTENSNKRKRQSSPVDVSRGHGKIIRIRLSSKKQNQSDAPPVNEQKHCSTSGRIHGPPQIENDVSLRQRSEGFCSTSGSTSNVGQSLVLKTGGEWIHVASNRVKTAAPLQTNALPAPAKKIKTASPLETKALPVANTVLTAMQKEVLLYQNLIENWVPPQMHDGCVDNGDEDWLFGGKSKLEPSEKRRVCRDDSIPCSNTLSLWPCAQYLPEVDLFALPFTVPF
ncbi:uncharacterized protein LOC131011111 [Salvia miltiorrhiza]|uniref:uncharacterized protein LOC131011111 n=1 Tax=Salvia miltiorrhiza TaxID=226208 RepID=UPI0025AC2016|nr:uncharacterized protein LOC131011111 [Salvia miltiorrhiza]